MTYTKQEWIDGETVISAERMGHIESGIKVALDAHAGLPRVLAGTAVMTPVEANVRLSVEVQFPEEFTEPPVVVVSPESGVPNVEMRASASAITRAGFTMNFYRASDTDTSVHWIAVGS